MNRRQEARRDALPDPPVAAPGGGEDEHAVADEGHRASAYSARLWGTSSDTTGLPSVADVLDDQRNRRRSTPNTPKPRPQPADDVRPVVRAQVDPRQPDRRRQDHGAASTSAARLPRPRMTREHHRHRHLDRRVGGVAARVGGVERVHERAGGPRPVDRLPWRGAPRAISSRKPHDEREQLDRPPAHRQEHGRDQRRTARRRAASRAR